MWLQSDIMHAGPSCTAMTVQGIGTKYLDPSPHEMLNLLHFCDVLMAGLPMRQQLAVIGQCSLQMTSMALEKPAISSFVADQTYSLP